MTEEETLELKVVKDQGIVKWGSLRVVILRADTLFDLINSIERFTSRPEILITLGQQIGYKYAENMKNSNIFEAKSLWTENKEDFLKIVLTTDTYGGWGRFELERAEKNKIVIKVYNSFLASIYLKRFGKSDHPICAFLLGYFQGILASIFNKDITEILGAEEKCEAMGDDYCQFEYILQ